MTKIGVGPVWLSNSTISRLRDSLRARGQQPSLVLSEEPMTMEEIELRSVQLEYGALVEVMYLMMSVDGAITNDERAILKGAIRNLSDGNVRSVHIEALVDHAALNSATQGRDRRLDDVCAKLRSDRARAEVTFILAAAVAIADNAVSDDENELLNKIADGLGIDEKRANELLDGVEADLASQQAH